MVEVGKPARPSGASEAAPREQLLGSSPHEEKEVTEYVEWELSKGTDVALGVEYLEPVKAEVVWGHHHKVWDVHTTDGRWWVVTEPMNLYSQSDFPSLDYVLSFHVGLMTRIASRDSRRATKRNTERFAAAWRRREQATEAVDAAKEGEDFQSVGMKCRECLLAFVRAAHEDLSSGSGPGLQGPDALSSQPGNRTKRRDHSAAMGACRLLEPVLPE